MRVSFLYLCIYKERKIRREGKIFRGLDEKELNGDVSLGDWSLFLCLLCEMKSEILSFLSLFNQLNT